MVDLRHERAGKGLASGALVVWTTVAVSAAPALQLGVHEVFRDDFEGDVSSWDVPGEVLFQAGAAHSGTHCLHGQLLKKNRGIRFTRAVKLTASRLYRLTLWVRSPQRGRLAVWANQGKGRFMIGMERAVPRKWRLFQYTFAPPKSGTWRLEIIAPSTYGDGKSGDMFVDDVRLTETVLPPTVLLSTGQAYAQYPALAAAAGGAVYGAWQTFEKGGDSLWAALLDRTGDGGVQVTHRWRVPVPGKGFVFPPRLAAGPAGVFLTAAVEVRGNWNIYLWPLTGEGPGKRVDVAVGPANELQPALAFAGSTLWLTWVSNAGGFRAVYAARFENGRFGPPTRISAAGCSNYTPSVVGAPDGQVWAAWSSFRNGDYDLYWNHYDGAQWEGEKEAVSSPWIEHRPVLAYAGGRVWMAWEAGRFVSYHTNGFAEKRVYVAQFTGDGWRAPRALAAGAGPWQEKPALLADAAGRVWLVVRRSRGQHAGWDAVLYTVNTGKASFPLCAKQGRARPVALTTSGRRLLVALETDNYGRSYPDENAAEAARSHVELAVVEVAETPLPAETALVPVDYGNPQMNLAEDRARRGEDLPPRTITYNGKTLHLYFGDFHDHSDISQCNRRGDLVPDDNYAHNRDIHRLDFSAMTDHGYNLTPALWQLTAENCRANTDAGRFLAFLGEEWTSTFEEYSNAHPFGFYGHRNLIFADPYFPRWFNARNRWTPRQVWDKLRSMKADFIQIPHQLADNGNVPTDWNFTDETAQPVAEIYQTRGSYEYRSAPGAARNLVPEDGYFIQDAWARGIVIGVIASPDHGGGHGKAAVYAPELTRSAILEAIRRRHTFGTSAARFFFDFRVNGRLMGEKLARPRAGQPVDISVKVVAPQEIESVDLCRNNRFIYSAPNPGLACQFTYHDKSLPAGPVYYYARVVQRDGQVGWTSPVWLGGK